MTSPNGIHHNPNSNLHQVSAASIPHITNTPPISNGCQKGFVAETKLTHPAPSELHGVQDMTSESLGSVEKCTKKISRFQENAKLRS